TRSQEQESNPEPGFLWAARPVDCGTAHLRLSGIEPLQADTEHIDLCSKKRQTKEIITPNGGLITAPNGGTDLATISFINLKSTPATNQESTQERGTGPQPSPMTLTLKQDDQAAKLRFLTNERTPGPSAILPSLDPRTQFLQACLSQCPDEPSLENVNLRSPGPPSPPPAVFCPPGVPFGPVHITDYPLKSEYKEYTLEKILKLYPLACIQSIVRYNRQGLWIFSTPKLFRGKFNYLPAYNLSMEPPVTPKPMPTSLPNLPANHSGKLFGIVYITLTGAIDTIIPAAGPWSWVRKLASYLLNLAPLLWWALPAKNLAQVTPENNGPNTQDWIPDTPPSICLCSMSWALARHWLREGVGNKGGFEGTVDCNLPCSTPSKPSGVPNAKVLGLNPVPLLILARKMRSAVGRCSVHAVLGCSCESLAISWTREPINCSTQPLACG
ncbi:hypothetical protein DSO57_1038286, partial [Entomophthora muscae]